MFEHHRETVAANKLRVPDNWKWFRWERIGLDAVALTGCTSSGPITRGPRKGRPRYDGAPQTEVVTDAEMEAERHRYQCETGRCGYCMGDGQEFARWTKDSGTEWKPCAACKGTGVHHESTAG